MTAAMAEAQAQARLAEVAANQAGVTEISFRLAQVVETLGEGRKSDAFDPLEGLLVTAGNTTWAPLLQREAEAVHENASLLYDRLSFGTDAEAAQSLQRLQGAAASLNEIFRLQYLPYHQSKPVGAVVHLKANLSGLFESDGAGGLLRNPVLRLKAGATMLVEVTNAEELSHNFAIPSLSLITRNFGANETVGLIVGPATPGDYRYFCDVPGHEASMNGHLIVSA